MAAQKSTKLGRAVRATGRFIAHPIRGTKVLMGRELTESQIEHGVHYPQVEKVKGNILTYLGGDGKRRELFIGNRTKFERSYKLPGGGHRLIKTVSSLNKGKDGDFTITLLEYDASGKLTTRIVRKVRENKEIKWKKFNFVPHGRFVPSERKNLLKPKTRKQINK